MVRGVTETMDVGLNRQRYIFLYQLLLQPWVDTGIICTIRVQGDGKWLIVPKKISITCILLLKFLYEFCSRTI